MKANEINIGGFYTAKVNGRLTTVRVDEIRSRGGYGNRVKDRTVYDVTNMATGRKTVFESAAKFRSVAVDPATITRQEFPILKTVETYRSPPSASNITEEPKAESGLAKALRKSIEKETGQSTSAPHLIVEARAGTGKTTTLVEGLKVVREIGSSLTPSPQQAAVWESMKLSAGAKTVCFVAFNKSIATELQCRVPAGCDAMTMHSMGFRAVTATFGRVRVNSYRVQDIISELLERDIRELRKYEPTMLKATEELVNLCKQNLVGTGSEAKSETETTCSPGSDSSFDAALDRLASHYDVDLNGSRSKVFALVPRVLDRCRDVAKDGACDFSDMIWLPIVLNLPLTRYDLLLVDEAQDLNRCQQALAKRAGNRLILCGDPKQAIYGFAGADAESMSRMASELSETARGCVTLPLTVTRRCGKAIVAEAQRIVPDFEAFETNSEGLISNAAFPSEESTPEQDYRGSVLDGDFILCRVNAPLVQQCFRFLKAGRKAQIQGRDIGAGLISTVKKLTKDSDDVSLLVAGLSDWLQSEVTKENAKRNPSEQRLITLQDRYDCLMCFADDATSVAAVIKKIEDIFTDDRNGSGIKLSSIHRAKGLEADRVFFINTKEASCPHPMAKSAWQRGQEQNLLYVGITRAKNELVWVR